MASLFKNLTYDIYPLFASLAAGTAVCGGYLYALAAKSPDVNFNIQGRNSLVKENFEEGKSFHEHSLRKYARKQDYHIFSGLNARFGGKSRKNPQLEEMHQADLAGKDH